MTITVSATRTITCAFLNANLHDEVLTNTGLSDLSVSRATLKAAVVYRPMASALPCN